MCLQNRLKLSKFGMERMELFPSQLESWGSPQCAIELSDLGVKRHLLWHRLGVSTSSKPFAVEREAKFPQGLRGLAFLRYYAYGERAQKLRTVVSISGVTLHCSGW